MSGNADLLTEISRLKADLDAAIFTLAKIASTPRNKGARQIAKVTLKFLQASDAKRTDGAAAGQPAALKG